MLAILLLVAGGFALRLAYLATPGLDSDQAIFGLMAMHILRGEWSPFLGAVEIWNRQYDGIAPNADGLRFAQEAELPAFVALDSIRQVRRHRSSRRSST